MHGGLRIPTFIDATMEDAGMKITEPDFAEKQHISRCRGELEEWYLDLRSSILNLGRDITVFTHADRRCTTFRRTKGFAYVNCQPRFERIAIDIPLILDDEEYDGEFLKAWQGQRQGNVSRIIVDGVEDIEGAKRLIRESYKSLD
jgi:predicted transport protein